MVHIAGSPCTCGPTDDYVSVSCRADLNDGGSSASDLEDLRGRFAAGERADGTGSNRDTFRSVDSPRSVPWNQRGLVYVGHPLRERRGGLRPRDTNGVFTISLPDCNPCSRMAAKSATRTAQCPRKLGRYSSAFCRRFVPNLSKIYRYWAEPARRAGLHPQDYDDFEYCPTAPPCAG